MEDHPPGECSEDLVEKDPEVVCLRDGDALEARQEAFYDFVVKEDGGKRGHLELVEDQGELQEREESERSDGRGRQGEMSREMSHEMLTFAQ